MRYIDTHTATELFNDMLDDVYPDYEVMGMTYSASSVLKNCDPVAYRCMFNDWLDAERLTTDESEAEE